MSTELAASPPRSLALGVAMGWGLGPPALPGPRGRRRPLGRIDRDDRPGGLGPLRRRAQGPDPAGRLVLPRLPGGTAPGHGPDVAAIGRLEQADRHLRRARPGRRLQDRPEKGPKPRIPDDHGLARLLQRGMGPPSSSNRRPTSWRSTGSSSCRWGRTRVPGSTWWSSARSPGPPCLPPRGDIRPGAASPRRERVPDGAAIGRRAGPPGSARERHLGMAPGHPGSTRGSPPRVRRRGRPRPGPASSRIDSSP